MKNEICRISSERGKIGTDLSDSRLRYGYVSDCGAVKMLTINFLIVNSPIED